MAQDAKVNNFISRCVANAEAILAAHNSAQDLRDEWAKLGLDASALDEVLQATQNSENDHLSGSNLVSYITSVDNLKSYIDAGNGTNLYRLKR